MRHTITAEQQGELKRAMNRTKDKKVYRRLKALIMSSQNKKSEEIAEATDYHPTYVRALVSKYCTQGLSAIVDNHYKGNNRNMTYEEEAALIEPFKKAAAEGKMVTVNEIKKAYEAKTGRSLDNNHGQIYFVLERHKWRKIMPRSKHPNKASDGVIEASKKLTLKSKK